MTLTLSIEAAGRTHVGLVRRRNEDSMHVGQWLFAVADGLGGHVAGDVASSAAIDALRAFDTLVEPTNLTTTLGRAVSEVNAELRRTIAADPQVAGMGTTLVAMLISGTAAALANVGDSRAYLLRGTDPQHRETVQISDDHTYGRLVAGASNVPNLPDRLARFLDGRTDGRSPDLATWQLQPGDRFLLCSDGLSSYVPHDLIHTTLSSFDGPGDVADQLVALALDRGGPDNVTMIVIDVRSVA
jgi:PPM family protein phosphatase